MPDVDFTQFDQMREEAHAEETGATAAKSRFRLGAEVGLRPFIV